jgi:hypothetical protein
MQSATWKRTALHLFRISWESAALILVWRFLFHSNGIISVTLYSMCVFCLHEWDLISRFYDYILWRIFFCVMRVKICLHSKERVWIGRVWEQAAKDRESNTSRRIENAEAINNSFSYPNNLRTNWGGRHVVHMMEIRNEYTIVGGYPRKDALGKCKRRGQNREGGCHCPHWINVPRDLNSWKAPVCPVNIRFHEKGENFWPAK